MIRIVTDSTASIPESVAKENDIDVVSLYINWRGVEYEDATMDIDSFYRDIYEMIDDIPTSSQPSLGVLESVFERAAENGDSIIGIFMSSKMSGTVDAALRAARSVTARHADFKFRIVDALSNSFDEAYAALAAAAGRAKGFDLNKCSELAARSAASTRFLFTPESLRFLKAGGRIGSAAALLGSIMKIRPILTVTDGETTTFAKVRSHKKAVEAMTEKFKSDIKDYGLKNVIVHYIGSPEKAIAWSKSVIEPLCGRDVDVVPVSPCIGLHVGPAIGIVYECEHALPGKLDKVQSVPVYSS